MFPGQARSRATKNTNMMAATHRFFLWSIATLVVLTSGCRTTQNDTPPDQPNAQLALAETIREIMQVQADAWNAGDISTFMQPYWRSPDLTFSSSGTTLRGYQATLDRYRKRYPTPEKMGKLTFSDLEVTRLNDAAALVLGRWHLERAEPVRGNFTLVFRQIEGEWRIVHDHTSALTEES